MNAKDPFFTADPQRENVPLDTPFFRAYRGLYPLSRFLTPHYHPEVEILFFEGLAGDTWISGIKHPFNLKAVQVIGPGKVHGFNIRPEGNGVVYVVQIDIHQCAKLLKGYPGFDCGVFLKELDSLPVNIPDKGKEILDAIYLLSPFAKKTEVSQAGAFSDLEGVGRILRLILGTHRPERSMRSVDERLRRILDAIEKDNDKPFDLTRLSKQVAISKHHLCRYFKKSTGMTLTDYSANIRVERAARLISEKGLTVTEAAFEAGFESVSYFIKVFRAIKGKSPKQWHLSLNSSNPGCQPRLYPLSPKG